MWKEARYCYYDGDTIITLYLVTIR